MAVFPSCVHQRAFAPGSESCMARITSFFVAGTSRMVQTRSASRQVCISAAGRREEQPRAQKRARAARRRRNRQRFSRGRRRGTHLDLLFRGRGMKTLLLADGRDRFGSQSARRCPRRQPHRSRGAPDDAVRLAARKKLLDQHAGPLPADQNGRASTCLELKVCQAIPSPSPKITRPGLADAGLYCQFVPNPSR